MSVTLRKKELKTRFHWYLDINVNGERSYEYLKLFTSKKVTSSEDRIRNKEIEQRAKEIRNKREQQLIENRYNLPKKEADIAFLEYFRILTDERKRSKGNYDNWDSVYKILKSYFSERSVYLTQMTEVELSGIKSFLLFEYKTKVGKPLSQNASSSYFNKIKACLKQAFSEGLISSDLGRRIKGIKPQDTGREFLTKDEIERIKKAECEIPVLKRAFMFSVYSGLRWSDIIKLQWSEIQYSEELGYFIRYKQEKTGTIEMLPIPSGAMQYAGEHGALEERVFKGLKYSSHTNLRLAQWMMRAKIGKKITFHSARHTYATRILTEGGDIYTLSKLLGHRSLKNTEIYTKVIDSKKIATVRLLDF